MPGALHRETPALSPEQISKLPKWARDHVRYIERERDEARAVLEEVKGTDPRPPHAVRDVYGEAVPVAWDRYDAIRFAQTGAMDDDTRDWIEVRRREEGEIEISASATLSITCQSSNVVYVRTS